MYFASLKNVSGAPRYHAAQLRRQVDPHIKASNGSSGQAVPVRPTFGCVSRRPGLSKSNFSALTAMATATAHTLLKRLSLISITAPEHVSHLNGLSSLQYIYQPMLPTVINTNNNMPNVYSAVVSIPPSQQGFRRGREFKSR